MIYNGFDIYLDTIPNTDTVLEHIVIDHYNIAYGSPTRARIVTVLHPSNNSDLSFVASSNCILDPQYPALEPSPREYDNTVLGRRFGVLVDDSNTASARRLSNRELLRCYSIPDNLLTTICEIPSHTYWLDDIMQSCIPVNIRSSITEQLVEHAGFADDML